MVTELVPKNFFFVFSPIAIPGMVKKKALFFEVWLLPILVSFFRHLALPARARYGYWSFQKNRYLYRWRSAGEPRTVAAGTPRLPENTTRVLHFSKADYR